MRRTITISLVLAWIALFIAIPAVTIAGDFHTVYHASQRLLLGKSLYSLEAIRELEQIWPSISAAGYPYPLSMAVVTVPFALLPLPVATVIWIALSTLSVWLVTRLQPGKPDTLMLALLFMPAFDAWRARQASILFLALIVLLLLGMRDRRAWLVGLCIALLPLKPQVGIFFTLYGLLWAWREDRRALGWAVGIGLAVWGGGLALQPNWPNEWLAALRYYSTINQPINMLPWSLTLVIVTWHMPWPARIAAAQVALFPLVGMYTLLPLLLVWMYLGDRRMALVGASLSWIYLPLAYTQLAIIIYMSTIVPLLVACYIDRRRVLFGQANAKPVQAA